tara:strand:+ start:43 stop:384 length:342 start_codon:yes stop_codon:yes gene_type:complete
MALVNNPQVANSPQANSAMASTNFGGAIAAGLGIQAWGPPGVAGLSLFGESGYYLIIQNTGLANLDVSFGPSATIGITIYPSATFEVALAQGAQVWLSNNTLAAGAAQAILFA